MITVAIANARVEYHAQLGWVVLHPSSDAVLAYCNTEDEAERVRYDIARISKRLVAERASEEKLWHPHSGECDCVDCDCSCHNFGETLDHDEDSCSCKRCDCACHS